MPPAKPSLHLLRSLTDEHVLRALLDERRLTRAELATRTGLSKPTVSESVRRLTEAGLLRDTGERTTGRGRVGSYYAIAEGVGVALAVSIAPEGIVAETIDVYGTVTSRAEEAVARPALPDAVTEALVAVCRRAQAEVPGPTRVAVVSAADPVDRESGRLVSLPDAPFLLGELSPVEALAGLVDGPVLVDNDVNWAARAEREADPSGRLDDFVYLYLGEGVGCAVVSDGEVRRGYGGIAGEIAHIVTTGPGGRAVRFTEVFGELGLRRAGSTAVDVDALLWRVIEPEAGSVELLEALADAVCGLLAAIVALADPEVVVLGGAWGAHPAVCDAVAARFEQVPRRVPVRTARVAVEPSLAGARDLAIQKLRAVVVKPLADVSAAPAVG